MEKDEHTGGSFVRLLAESKSLSRDALEILSASWRVGTGKRYNQATTEMGIEFLTEYFNTGVGYSSVNSVRSGLSSIIKSVMSHLLNHLWYTDFSKGFLILG